MPSIRLLCLVMSGVGSERCLRLAAAGDAAVRAGSCSTRMAVSKSVSTLGQPAASLANGGYLLIFHFNQRTCSPAATLGHRLLIGSEVENDEEDKVGSEDADSGDGSEFLTGAPAGIG